MGWLLQRHEVVLSGHRSIHLREGEEPPPLAKSYPVRKLTLPGMLVSNRLPTRSVILRRDLPFRFGDRRVTEDYLLWLEIVASGAPCYFLDVALAFSFRPDYSPEGYSGQLWAHERRELAALASLRAAGRLPLTPWFLASGWSLCKYARRKWLATRRAAVV
jgi:hypothetical protein